MPPQKVIVKCCSDWQLSNGCNGIQIVLPSLLLPTLKYLPKFRGSREPIKHRWLPHCCAAWPVTPILTCWLLNTGFESDFGEIYVAKKRTKELCLLPGRAADGLSREAAHQRERQWGWYSSRHVVARLGHITVVQQCGEKVQQCKKRAILTWFYMCRWKKGLYLLCFWE